MEPFLILLAIGYLALPIVAAVMAFSNQRRLQEITQRLKLLEQSGTIPAERSDLETDTVAEPAPEQLPLDNIDADAEAESTELQESNSEPEAEPQDDADRPPEKSKAPPRDIETLIGAKWSVLLGGVTLAIGLVFLARYSIESGILGPAARLSLGGAFSVLLLGLGEWLRRRDQKLAIPAIENADIPGIVTGAGISGGFAALFAAHAVYGFVGPGVAFVGLTVLGLAALLLSSLHGPKLAALGVLGAYVTPILVSSDEPNSLALAIHVLIVTAAVLTVARLRNWLWLGLAGVVASVAWTGLAALSTDTNAALSAIMLLWGLGLAFPIAFAWQLHEPSLPPNDRKTDWIPAVLSMGLLFLAYIVQVTANGDLVLVPTALVFSVLLMAAAAYWSALVPISLISALAVLLVAAALELPWKIVDGLTQTRDLIEGLVPPDTATYVRNLLIVAIPAGALALLAGLRSSENAPKSSGWLAASSGVMAFFGLIIAYLRIAPFETRPLIGAIALILATGFTFLSEITIRKRPEDFKAPAPAAWLITAIGCLSVAIGISLDTGWMPIAFAATALGISMVFVRRNLPLLPWLAVAAGLLAFVPAWFKAPFGVDEVSSRLFFNALMPLLGIPAVILVASGERLRRSGAGTPASLVIAIGLAFAGMFAGLEIQHALNDGNLERGTYGLAEHAAQTLTALAFAIGLQLTARSTQASIYHVASMAAGVISMLMIGSGLLIFLNPVISGDKVGTGLLFNLLLPGYLLPALLAAAAALIGRSVRPRWYTLFYAALSGLLLFAYTSLMLRKAFKGDNLAIWSGATDTEFWSYSALWLVLGAAVLALGIFLKSAPVRLASGLLIALTVCKVFLLDMSSLEGALRAFSFIGLGASLLAIGRFYQRLMRGQTESPEAEGS